MPRSAALCEQGSSPSLSKGCRNITPLSIAQVTCLSVDIVTIYMLRNANRAVLFSLIMSNSPHFLELHYGALHSDGLISISYSMFALLNNIVCSFHTRRHVCVLYPVAVPRRVGTHAGHAYSRRVPAAAGFSTHNMAGPSDNVNAWGYVILLLLCIFYASNNVRLVPSFSFPLADSDGEHG